MAVKIRLKRMGKKKQPTYRVVVADSRAPRDGRIIERLGRYDPRQEPSLVEIDNERAQYWLSTGAQPTDRVRKLLEISGAVARAKVSRSGVYRLDDAPPPAPPAAEQVPVEKPAEQATEPAEQPEPPVEQVEQVDQIDQAGQAEQSPQETASEFVAEEEEKEKEVPAEETPAEESQTETGTQEETQEEPGVPESQKEPEENKNTKEKEEPTS